MLRTEVWPPLQISLLSPFATVPSLCSTTTSAPPTFCLLTDLCLAPHAVRLTTANRKRKRKNLHLLAAHHLGLDNLLLIVLLGDGVAPISFFNKRDSSLFILHLLQGLAGVKGGGLEERRKWVFPKETHGFTELVVWLSLRLLLLLRRFVL